MSYPSVDQLQNALARDVFNSRQDTKKAAGRALGTVVELITYHIVRQWKLLPNLTIELCLPEFGNSEITHNVEFGLHPIRSSTVLELPKNNKSITSLAILKAANLDISNRKSHTLLTANGLMKNACLITDRDGNFLVAHLRGETDSAFLVDLTELRKAPFAMIECKRVGVEEGAKKGPTTIEKAKQGAYVAKHVSALQKVRASDGTLYGIMALPDGGLVTRPWEEELKRIVNEAPASELEGFILTIGVVSNHGNWFTSDNPNKELKVLRQSYDWLLFLNDGGIAEFVTDTILSGTQEMQAVRDAFAATYGTDRKGGTRFTKVHIDFEAHKALDTYFAAKMGDIEKTWLSVLSPPGNPVSELNRELHTLNGKDWK